MASCKLNCRCGEPCCCHAEHGGNCECIEHWREVCALDQTGKLGHEEAHLTEADFLAQYKQRDYPKPSVTVDLVIFTVTDSDLKVLLIERKGHPYKGAWALPGGFVDVGDGYESQGEPLYTAACRELQEETGIDRVFLEQLYTFGNPYRDPRMRVISVAYYALVPPSMATQVKPGSDAARVQWHSVSSLTCSMLAFDHADILSAAVARIRGKIDYTDIAFELVPETFTVQELRAVYEAVKGNTYDSANFRRRFKRMLTDDIIEEAPGKRQTSTKPARVYRFSHNTGRKGSPRRTSSD